MPIATYRLQLSGKFRFRDATRIVAYLNSLGISDAYVSPVLRARAGSEHGYDIVSYSEISPELGGEKGLDSFSRALKSMGLGLVLDIVPNHMSASGENRMWTHVSEFGRSSPFATLFDIRWTASGDLRNRLVLPVLLDDYAACLERGELRIELPAAMNRLEARVRRDLAIPITPSSYVEVIRRAASGLSSSHPGSSAASRFDDIARLVRTMPNPTEDWSPRKELDEGDERELERLLGSALRLKESRGELLAAISEINQDRGDLDSVLQRQFYHLEYWRMASRDINYRRFLDVNDLVAVRVEDPAVFATSHRLLLELARTGRVTGLRIDHVDGLMDPTAYLRRLRRASSAKGRRVYVVAEKVLTHGEELPRTWDCDGTTGYDFMNEVNRLFVWKPALPLLDETYREFTGRRDGFPELVYRSKLGVLEGSMISDVRSVVGILQRLNAPPRQRSISPVRRDAVHEELLDALKRFVACFPVYRTYVSAGRPRPTRAEAREIEAGLAAAKKVAPGVGAATWGFLRRQLLSGSRDENRLEFMMRLQILCAAVMVKGFEDTALYNFDRLVSLNEVGGDPVDSLEEPLSVFHSLNIERARRHPHSLLASTTHDTKRSEDVRARINALSEFAEEWKDAVYRWSNLNQGLKTPLRGREAPSGNDEYLFYQTLLGSWPVENSGSREYVGRIVSYMRKASKEEKRETSWVDPDEEYDASLEKFVVGSLSSENEGFVNDLLEFERKVASIGMLNSLSQLVLKLTCPGVPDIYQGNELWDFSLADPDNRRQVDFSLRKRLLETITSEGGADRAQLFRGLLREWRDGRVKMFTTQRILEYRRRHPTLFSDGAYIPLLVEGPHGESVCVFERKRGRKSCIVVVGRFFARLGYLDPESKKGELWDGTRIAVGRSRRRYRNIFTEGVVESKPDGARRWLNVAELLNDGAPVALLDVQPD